jgi:alanine-glyoxylate transaminase/serine-glyoxylate transaminase/serine-pyruvate transaminase
MILTEEGLEAVWARHSIFAQAVWAAVEAWGAGGALELNIADPALRSHAVTTIRTGPGDGARLRRWCADVAGVTLGIGLAVPRVDPDSTFRIGHMGHLNPPMLLGTLATIEAGFQSLGIPYGAGGVAAAGAVIAAAGGRAPAPVSPLETGVEIV